MRSSNLRYILNKNGTISDKRTGLMWQKSYSYPVNGVYLNWFASWDYEINWHCLVAYIKKNLNVSFTIFIFEKLHTQGRPLIIFSFKIHVRILVSELCYGIDLKLFTITQPKLSHCDIMYNYLKHRHQSVANEASYILS